MFFSRHPYLIPHGYCTDSFDIQYELSTSKKKQYPKTLQEADCFDFWTSRLISRRTWYLNVTWFFFSGQKSVGMIITHHDDRWTKLIPRRWPSEVNHSGKISEIRKISREMGRRHQFISPTTQSSRRHQRSHRPHDSTHYDTKRLEMELMESDFESSRLGQPARHTLSCVTTTSTKSTATDHLIHATKVDDDHDVVADDDTDILLFLFQLIGKGFSSWTQQ